MFDLIISQSTVSWKAPLNEDGSLPPTITFGTSVLTTSDFKNLVQNQDGLQQHLNSLYQLFREEIVVLMERLRFLYLVNSVGVGHIEKKKDWGELSKKLKVLQTRLSPHFQGDYTPDSKAFVQAYTKMQDNLHRTKGFLSLNHVVVFPTANFTSGSLEIINQLLGTKFADEESFIQAIEKLYKIPLEKDKANQLLVEKEVTINLAKFAISNLPNVINLAQSFSEAKEVQPSPTTATGPQVNVDVIQHEKDLEPQDNVLIASQEKNEVIEIPDSQEVSVCIADKNPEITKGANFTQEVTMLDLNDPNEGVNDTDDSYTGLKTAPKGRKLNLEQEIAHGQMVGTNNS